MAIVDLEGFHWSGFIGLEEMNLYVVCCIYIYLSMSCLAIIIVGWDIPEGGGQ